MAVSLLVALLQAGVALPPPPMVATAVSPPPITSVPMMPSPPLPSAFRPGPPILVDVRVTAGDRVLFADMLRVDTMSGANYSQNRSEAPARACPADRYGNQQSTAFSVRLHNRVGEVGRKSLSVNVNWSRPVDGGGCPSGGSRGVSINQVVEVEPGKRSLLTGDGGLRVELTPR
jgi:hypothetical protein